MTKSILAELDNEPDTLRNVGLDPALCAPYVSNGRPESDPYLVAAKKIWPVRDSSLRPPRMPSDVAPYSVPPVPALWAAWLYAFAACGVIAALYLGIAFEVHYQIGGFLGLAWLVSVAFAGAIVGATLLLVWEMRRGE